jgi:squalene-hopene/tetraprenyl-beta-curcumene cyclase
MRLSPLKDTPYIVPSLDVTCHVTTFLAEVLHREAGAVRAGSSWILKKQAADGSWSADWAMRKTYGTMCAVEALVASGVPARHDAIQRAVQWLESAQNQDGGWGEDWDAQPAASTVEQTAYALICLANAGVPPDSSSFSRGLDFVLRSQEYDGRWPPSQTGSFLQRITGAYNTNHYPTIFALQALLAAQKRLHSAGGS